MRIPITSLKTLGEFEFTWPESFFFSNKKLSENSEHTHRRISLDTPVWITVPRMVLNTKLWCARDLESTISHSARMNIYFQKRAQTQNCHDELESEKGKKRILGLFVSPFFVFSSSLRNTCNSAFFTVVFLDSKSPLDALFSNVASTTAQQ